MRALVLILAAGTLIAVSGCDGDENDSSTTAANASTTTGEGSNLSFAPKRVDLVHCPVHGGGFDVQRANIPCDEVQRTLADWGPADVFEKDVSHQAVFLKDHGWQCWSSLERFGILNICMRGDQVITYKFA